MFDSKTKQRIARQIQAILRATGDVELPQGEIQFLLHVEGASFSSWGDIRNNGAIENGAPEISDELIRMLLHEVSGFA